MSEIINAFNTDTRAENTDPSANPLIASYAVFIKEHPAPTPQDYGTFLKAAHEQQWQTFKAHTDINELLAHHAALIDQILTGLWDKHVSTPTPALIAVGGYGRAEMHPSSDIDLLILLDGEPDAEQESQLSQFLTVLWDIGLEVGHSVRTLPECLNAAEEDLTIITNLIESRHLAGNQALFSAMRAGIRTDTLWGNQQFLTAKLQERQDRYKKFGDSAYRVEPNLKEGPGGLRDIQMISWIVERAYGSLSLKALYRERLLTRDEFTDLQAGREFLWNVRFVLHHLAGRKEDRLLFDYQYDLATAMGFEYENRNEAVEAFMQYYYRNITKLERLSDLLIGILRSKLTQDQPPPREMVGEYYRKRGDLLAIRSAEDFEHYPTALLEIFLILQVNPSLTGLRPQTIRLIRNNLHRIDASFRQQARHREIFMQILRNTQGITYVIRLMNRYGVLAAYLPAFANIVGRMQYDLFHAYTVDEHTLFVLRNVRRYSTKEGAEELPFCSQVFHTLHKPEILYIAALFHDIAKGRNGDHSVLGAKDVELFCREHGVNLHDTTIASWLVRNHLLMSAVAQRKDISDPAVIHDFADKVATQNRLDYLFLLTIADMRGTNPKLWNSWKQTLLIDLYTATRTALRERTSVSEATQNILLDKRTTALTYLEAHGFSQTACTTFWDKLGEDYLLQHTIESICWHTEMILSADISINPNVLPLVEIRVTSSGGSNAIFIYSEERDDLFMRVVSTLEQLNLDVVQAQLVDHENRYDLYTLHILGPDNKTITSTDDQQHIVKALRDNLLRETFIKHEHRQPRILRNFDIPTRVKFRQDKKLNQTLMEVHTGDMPGLLSRISDVLIAFNLRIHNARISTLGEQAEDMFYVTDADNHTITDEATQQQIRERLVTVLDKNSA